MVKERAPRMKRSVKVLSRLQCVSSVWDVCGDSGVCCSVGFGCEGGGDAEVLHPLEMRPRVFRERRVTVEGVVGYLAGVENEERFGVDRL